MKNERVPHPVISIMAVSKQIGLIPTSAYARHAGCYVHIEPLLWCSLCDPKALCQILENIAAKPVPEVDLSFEEVKKSSMVADTLGNTKAVFVGLSVLPDMNHLRIRRSNAKGEWLGEPYAFEKKFLKEAGMEPVAQAIVQHLQTRKDLPDVAYIPSQHLAQSA